jgi:hypothetical protein
VSLNAGAIALGAGKLVGHLVVPSLAGTHGWSGPCRPSDPHWYGGRWRRFTPFPLLIIIPAFSSSVSSLTNAATRTSTLAASAVRCRELAVSPSGRQPEGVGAGREGRVAMLVVGFEHTPLVSQNFIDLTSSWTKAMGQAVS